VSECSYLTSLGTLEPSTYFDVRANGELYTLAELPQSILTEPVLLVVADGRSFCYQEGPVNTTGTSQQLL
jgi:hypothetical protein